MKKAFSFHIVFRCRRKRRPRRRGRMDRLHRLSQGWRTWGRKRRYLSGVINRTPLLMTNDLLHLTVVSLVLRTSSPTGLIAWMSPRRHGVWCSVSCGGSRSCSPPTCNLFRFIKYKAFISMTFIYFLWGYDTLWFGLEEYVSGVP